MSKPLRALLAMDAAGAVRVLATDSEFIQDDLHQVSTDAIEMGIVDETKPRRGSLWL